MKRLLFQSITLALMLMALLVGCTPAAEPTPITFPPNAPTLTPIPTIALGPAPTRTFTLATGEETSLAAWRGKGVILNFWATWCIPCRTEMPLLADFNANQEDIDVIGVNYIEDQQSVEGFVANFNIPFPIVVDQRGFLAGELNVKGLPTTVYINTEGQIVGSHIGPVTQEMLDAMIPLMLDGGT